jgi:hypothetical protein
MPILLECEDRELQQFQNFLRHLNDLMSSIQSHYEEELDSRDKELLSIGAQQAEIIKEIRYLRDKIEDHANERTSWQSRIKLLSNLKVDDERDRIDPTQSQTSHNEEPAAEIENF